MDADRSVLLTKKFSDSLLLSRCFRTRAGIESDRLVGRLMGSLARKFLKETPIGRRAVVSRLFHLLRPLTSVVGDDDLIDFIVETQYVRMRRIPLTKIVSRRNKRSSTSRDARAEIFPVTGRNIMFRRSCKNAAKHFLPGVASSRGGFKAKEGLRFSFKTIPVREF